jgi:hypothetical protein
MYRKSATLLISYLIRKESWSFRRAIGLVRDKRSVICPNLGFERQLKEYEKSIMIKPRSYSIRFGPKSSDEPRPKHSNERTSLPGIPSTLNRTQLKINHLKEYNILAKHNRRNLLMDSRLDLTNNFIINGFKPTEKNYAKMIPHTSG